MQACSWTPLSGVGTGTFPKSGGPLSSILCRGNEAWNKDGDWRGSRCHRNVGMMNDGRRRSSGLRRRNFLERAGGAVSLASCRGAASKKLDGQGVKWWAFTEEHMPATSLTKIRGRNESNYSFITAVIPFTVSMRIFSQLFTSILIHYTVHSRKFVELNSPLSLSSINYDDDSSERQCWNQRRKCGRRVTRQHDLCWADDTQTGPALLYAWTICPAPLGSSSSVKNCYVESKRVGGNW